MLYEPNNSFDFDSVRLGSPNALQGGSYFTKFLVDNNPLYLQIPKCALKQGLVVTEKKKYCDLMFTQEDTEIIEWFEKIEKKGQELMFEKKDIWFHDDLEISDIESAFTSPIRSYKSGRFNLVRCMFPKIINTDTISCYNENEEPISIDVLNEENIEIIPLIEVQGVKFSSKNFQIEIGMKQIMVIKKNEVFKNCMIKLNTTSSKPAAASHADEDDREEEEENNAPSPLALKNVEAVVEHNCEDNAVDTPENQDMDATELKENMNAETDEDLEEAPGQLEEVDLTIDDNNSSLVLKHPNEVYYTLWRTARQKAKTAKKEAIMAYLEAKKIKENYMLDALDSDSDYEEEEYEKSMN